MHIHVHRHTSDFENEENLDDFKETSWSQIALPTCIALGRQVSSSAWLIAEVMFGCTNCLVEFFQAALNTKALLVGHSFCFQSSIMKKMCANIVVLLCLLLLSWRKRRKKSSIGKVLCVGDSS